MIYTRESLIIVLSPEDCELARTTGEERRAESRRIHLQLEHGHSGKASIVTDIDGAGAEIALCRYLGIAYEKRLNTFHLPDVGRDIQVKSTQYEHGHLIFRPPLPQYRNPGDDPSHTYVLMIGKLPRYRVAGFLEGWNCQLAEWWRTPKDELPAWWVPQSALKPAEQLKQKQLL